MSQHYIYPVTKITPARFLMHLGASLPPSHTLLLNHPQLNTSHLTTNHITSTPLDPDGMTLEQDGATFTYELYL